MKSIKPFADDAASVGIDELTIENGTERIALYGSIDLTRDKVGLKHARELRALLDAIVQALESEKDLPEKQAPPDEPEQVDNPFQ